MLIGISLFLYFIRIFGFFVVVIGWFLEKLFGDLIFNEELGHCVLIRNCFGAIWQLRNCENYCKNRLGHKGINRVIGGSIGFDFDFGSLATRIFRINWVSKSDQSGLYKTL